MFVNCVVCINPQPWQTMFWICDGCHHEQASLRPLTGGFICLCLKQLSIHGKCSLSSNRFRHAIASLAVKLLVCLLLHTGNEYLLGIHQFAQYQPYICSGLLCCERHYASIPTVTVTTMPINGYMNWMLDALLWLSLLKCCKPCISNTWQMMMCGETKIAACLE